MAKRRAFLTILVAAVLTGSALAAPATTKVLSIADHVPQLDGPMTSVTDSNGRTVAAWAYRFAGEFDIAVSTRDAESGTFGAPVFFGRRSGSNEVDPVVAFDSRGTAYLAFSMASPARVALTILSPGSTVWSEPVIVSGTEAASSPGLRVVGEHVVVAYRTAHGVGLADIATVGTGNQTNGIQDGPDGVDPLGIKGKGSQSDTTPVGPPGSPAP